MEKFNDKDKSLIREIANHFKFSLGDALEVFRYAEYRKYKQKKWINEMIEGLQK